MPRGPQGQHRPADVIGTAVKVARIATGEIMDERDPVQTAGQILGRQGGKARARKLSPKQRTQIARKAAKTRWVAHEDMP